MADAGAPRAKLSLKIAPKPVLVEVAAPKALTVVASEKEAVDYARQLRSLMDAKKFKEALGVVEEGLKLHSTDKTLRTYHMRALINNGRAPEAVALAAQLRQEYPRDKGLKNLCQYVVRATKRAQGSRGKPDEEVGDLVRRRRTIARLMKEEDFEGAAMRLL